MNATGKKFTKRQRQVVKEFAKQYDMLRCERFKQNFEDTTRQTAFVMLSGILMHGSEQNQGTCGYKYKRILVELEIEE